MLCVEATAHGLMEECVSVGAVSGHTPGPWVFSN